MLSLYGGFNVFANSEDSEQPWAFWIPKDAKFVHSDYEYSNQTRLTWVFVGCTYQKVCLLSLRLWEKQSKQLSLSLKGDLNARYEHMSCDIKNVTYIMKCRGFGEEYIGEAGNFLRKKATIHNQHIRDPQTRMIKVSEHIDICAKKCIPNIQVTRFVRCTQTVQTFDGQKNNVHKCIKAKTNITKTRLFKFIENFTSKNWKILDKKHRYFFIFLLKT